MKQLNALERAAVCGAAHEFDVILDGARDDAAALEAQLADPSHMVRNVLIGAGVVVAGLAIWALSKNCGSCCQV